MLLSAIFQIQFVRSPVNLFIYHATIAWFYFTQQKSPLNRGGFSYAAMAAVTLVVVVVVVVPPSSGGKSAGGTSTGWPQVHCSGR